MDLLDNYLNTIRWNLPRGANADDIVAELQDVIASRIEEREDALNRPLTKDETSAVLRDFGHPLVVAARYGTQQWLIGPEVFPFYLFSLKIVLAISLVILVFSGAAGGILGDQHAMRTVMQGLHEGWWSLLANAGLVTLIFAVIERTGWLNGYLRNWSPEHLPDLGKLKRKPKSAWELVFEIGVGIAFVLWWVGAIHVPVVYAHAEDLNIEAAPVWAQYYWPILALLVGRVGYNIVRLLRPRWLAVHAAIAVGLAAVGVAVLTLIYRAGAWVLVSSPTIAPDKLADLQRSLDLSAKVTLVAIGAMLVAQALGAVWRWYRGKRG